MSATGRPAAGARAEPLLLRALSRPETYPGTSRPVTVIETHISWVFLAGACAYKLKKPIVLDFLDYGTPARRLRMCREEIRLNRRLAPEVYLDVISIAARPGGPALAGERDPDALDHLVRMRRYRRRDTLAARLAAGRLTHAEVRDVAELLAGFHARARPAPARAQPLAPVRDRVRRNVRELLQTAPGAAEATRVRALARSLEALLTLRAQPLAERARAGLVREGHGDLRAEHVLLSRPPQVVDCVEFDLALRELDVAEDLSFLVMDLQALGGGEFAATLLDAYRAAGGDPGGDELIALFACHRALVRAKVAFTRAAQQRGGARERSHREGRALLAVAERFGWRARLPLTIVLCGLPAAGKSTLAERLSAASGLPVVGSDQTRKRLAGLAAGERGPQDIYTPRWNRRVYAELGRLAAAHAGAGGGAIVDGTFRSEADRSAFAGSFAGAAPTVFVECLAPRAHRLERAARRERRGSSHSDASAALVAGEAFAWEELDDASAGLRLRLRTDRPPDAQLADLAARLDRLREPRRAP